MTVRDLTMVYRSPTGPVHALDRVSLEARTGEFISVLGPSGCGKSTLMMLVAGLRPKTAGSVTMNGQEVDGPQTDVGIVFQRDVLLDWRTNLDNIMLQIEFRKLDQSRFRSTAMELMRQVGLKGFELKRPYELSGGMRQRVSICRALVHDPPILLMDEPFGALDALTREQLMVDLEALWMARAQTVLFITHSIQEAVLLSDRILLMTPRPGRILREFPVDLPRPRPLALMTSPDFNERVREIRDSFTEIGVIRDIT
jgi:NitT/TauT family transport system ATP-binding protein